MPNLAILLHPTTQQQQGYNVSFDASTVCADCTVRLERRADEWGSNYRFQSCADVDIVSELVRLDMTNQHTEHGKILAFHMEPKHGGTCCAWHGTCYVQPGSPSMSAARQSRHDASPDVSEALLAQHRTCPNKSVATCFGFHMRRVLVG